ncbi:MAG: sigma 54-interacting transcriptional regulator [Myxococcota bacterium]|jgi:DNA-binding NtrC family response regulator|nr:sigma 54-interacting transcriptional regulator [Myxococcota bacterium]
MKEERTTYARIPDSRKLRTARLRVVDGQQSGQTFLINRSRTCIGRSSINEVCLDEPRISLRHAEIEFSDGELVLRDLGSTNGTRVGGIRIREVILEAGTRFSVGNTTLQLELLDDVVEIPLFPGERFGKVSGRSLAMREIFAIAAKIAPSELTVLITGETGTGKERLARSIHDASPRASKPYVVLDCSSIPKELAESVVFGHERGSFTGAVAQHKGVFEQAHGGTIFLDEIGELDLSLQPKLLRVLENRELRRVGSDRIQHVDVRLIAATHRDLSAMVAEGSFREDLYFRLSVVQCELPPLRERRDDIELLARELLEALASQRAHEGYRLSQEGLRALLEHPWPGNVRELRNVLERAISLTDASVLGRSELFPAGEKLSRGARAQRELAQREGSSELDLKRPYKLIKQEVVDRFERRYLLALAQEFEGNLSKASREVALSRYHLREMLKKHGLLHAFRRED